MPSIDTSAGPIFYAARGEAGPALLCLHGAGGSHTHWGHLLAGLGDVARVIAPDLPGHGRSAPPGRSTIAGYAAAALALLDALGLERAILCGHSMGAAVALQLALDAPGRAAGLALVGASARLRVLPALISGLEQDPERTIDQLVTMMYPTGPDELRAAARADYARCDPLVFRDDFLACDGWDIRQGLGELCVPAIVVGGELDQLTPPKLWRELHAGIAGATLAALPETGHVPMIERPAETAAALRGWLQQASPR